MLVSNRSTAVTKAPSSAQADEITDLAQEMGVEAEDSGDSRQDPCREGVDIAGRILADGHLGRDAGAIATVAGEAEIGPVQAEWGRPQQQKTEAP